MSTLISGILATALMASQPNVTAQPITHLDFAHRPSYEVLIEQQPHHLSEDAAEKLRLEVLSKESSDSEQAARTVSFEPIILGTFTITAYCPCVKCNEQYANGITATGVTAKSKHTIAVDPSVIPYGTVVEIDGIHYTAEDCGGAIKGNKIDIYFDSHRETTKYGVQQHEVLLVK